MTRDSNDENNAPPAGHASADTSQIIPKEAALPLDNSILDGTTSETTQTRLVNADPNTVLKSTEGMQLSTTDNYLLSSASTSLSQEAVKCLEGSSMMHQSGPGNKPPLVGQDPSSPAPSTATNPTNHCSFTRDTQLISSVPTFGGSMLTDVVMVPTPTDMTMTQNASTSLVQLSETQDVGNNLLHYTTTPSTELMGESIAMSKASEDAVALAAMQEAAAIVMEAENLKKRKVGEVYDNHLEQQPQHQLSQMQYLPSINHTQTQACHDQSSRPSHPQSAVKKRTATTRISWEERLQQLRAYKEEHGNLLIPIRYKLNPSLGKFVHNTREQFKLFHKQTPEGYKKKCSLTAKRIEQLEELGFAWTTERTKQQNEDWKARLKQLQEFKEKHGHCLVPHGYQEDPSFAEWVHRQRTTNATMMKDTKKNPVIQQRMQQLRNMGFNFTVHSDKWMDHWNQLKVYKEKNGDCQVPTHYAENPKLGRWVHTQRHQRRLQSKGKKSCMTQERIDLLDQLGFSWEVRPSLERPKATWQQNYDEIVKFHKKHNHFRIDPTKMPELHRWCHEQRLQLRSADQNKGNYFPDAMRQDQIAALNRIGFISDTQLMEANRNKFDRKDTSAETSKGQHIVHGGSNTQASGSIPTRTPQIQSGNSHVETLGSRDFQNMIQSKKSLQSQSEQSICNRSSKSRAMVGI